MGNRATSEGEERKTPDKMTMKISEMAAYLGIGRNVAYELAHSKDFYPAFNIGRKILINIDKLKKWVDEQTLSEVD